jgi:hypothetical protein
MGSTTRFSSNFSIPITRISRRWLTRLSLSKKRSKRWRRMARAKHHSWDSLREATPSLSYLSQGLSSETRARFAHRCMTTSFIPYAMTELSGTAPELPDAEASATGSSTQCAATVLPEHTTRPLHNRSNLTECTRSGKP